MAISLIPVVDSDLELYKYDMQEAFQRGYEDVLGPTNEVGRYRLLFEHRRGRGLSCGA